MRAVAKWAVALTVGPVQNIILDVGAVAMALGAIGTGGHGPEGLWNGAMALRVMALGAVGTGRCV